MTGKGEYMFCQSCGSELPNDANFCNVCGTRLSSAMVSETPPYQAHYGQDDGLFKRIFSKVFIFLFMSGMLIMCFLLLRYLMA